ncbi:MAG TPA: RnfABCDGE type electron transport complex subunit D [Clostridiaceae bacterium]|nr:RnfABCDGE type electron transport complex subunit D [Clostridiaceae bacterium]
MEHKLIGSSSPHIKDKVTTSRIMLDVIIALLPAALMGVIFFGTGALVNIFAAIAACVLGEYIWNRGMKKPQSIHDCSAIVTGLLLAMTVSPKTPFWMLILGGFFAIIIVKQLFGGIGMNFLNPALAARAMMMASWPAQMTAWQAPNWMSPLPTDGLTANVDAVAGATPLALQKLIIGEGGVTAAQLPSYKDLFLGNVMGSIGETCALALLLGGVYLIIRGVISWEIPVLFAASTALLSLILGVDPLFNLLSGGLMIGAIFMATDYTTSPMTFKARCIYAVGCGLLTVVIRVYGGYPEGVSYAILLMNLVVPLLDKAFIPKSFGTIHVKKGEAAK